MTFDQWYALQEEKHGTPPFACSYDAARFAWQSSIQENALQALSDMTQEFEAQEPACIYPQCQFQDCTCLCNPPEVVTDSLTPEQVKPRVRRMVWPKSEPFPIEEMLTTLISEPAIKETGVNLKQDHTEDKLEMVQPAAPAAEPVAYVLFSDNGRNIRLWSRFSDEVHKVADKEGRKVVPLYAQQAPALRELRDEQLNEIFNGVYGGSGMRLDNRDLVFVRAVIAAARSA